jgi:hypothetical protein
MVIVNEFEQFITDDADENLLAQVERDGYKGLILDLISPLVDEEAREYERFLYKGEDGDFVFFEVSDEGKKIRIIEMSLHVDESEFDSGVKCNVFIEANSCGDNDDLIKLASY